MPARSVTALEPEPDCPACPRLAAFRNSLRSSEPSWHNAPVPAFGDEDARLLIVGLAPGLRGANRTGRPFTGDYAGELLYETLIDCGLAAGAYGAEAGDGLTLISCMIANAVRCVPPQNRPSPAEVHNCRSFLAARISSLPHLRVIVALGRIAHESVLRVFGLRLTSFPFAHGAEHIVRAGDPQRPERSLMLIDSYHCSRYNTATGVLTRGMFRSVFAKACERL
ncbi:MAG TPA: uracil-DNA glycosylase [Methylocella sp.]|nr:uracil-DNA glycosylase [Methylocella sp.]